MSSNNPISSHILPVQGARIPKRVLSSCNARKALAKAFCSGDRDSMASCRIRCADFHHKPHLGSPHIMDLICWINQRQPRSLIQASLRFKEMVSKCINTLQHLRVLELLRRRNCGQLQGNLKLVLRKVQRHKQHQNADWTISRRVFQYFEATKWYHIYQLS